MCTYYSIISRNYAYYIYQYHRYTVGYDSTIGQQFTCFVWILYCFDRGFTALLPNSAAVVRRRRQNEYSASRRNLTTNHQRKRPMSASVVRSRSKPRQHPLQSFGQNRPPVQQVSSTSDLQQKKTKAFTLLNIFIH